MYFRPQQPHGEGVTVGFGFLAVIMVILGIFSLFSSINYYLVNIPYYTLLGFQIWRIFTAFVAMPDILTMIFTLIVLYMMSFEEYRVGSSRFVLTMFFRNIAIQIGVVVIGLILQLLTGLPVYSFGIWPVLMTTITMRCLENPEGETTLCFGSCPIRNKYYPLVILAIFVAFASLVGLPVDFILGYLLGLWMHNKPNVRQTIDPSYKTVMSFENFLRNLDGKLGLLIGENEAGHFDVGGHNPPTQPQLMGYQQNPQYGYQGQGYPPQGQGYAMPGQGYPPQGQYFNPGRPGGYPPAPQPFTGRGVSIGGAELPPVHPQPYYGGYPPQPFTQAPMNR